MAKIGTFTKEGDVYKGTICTLTLNVKVEIAPVDKTGEKAPDYRVYSNGSELGAGWKQTSEQGTDYISVKLDDPSLSAPIYTSLQLVKLAAHASEIFMGQACRPCVGHVHKMPVDGESYKCASSNLVPAKGAMLSERFFASKSLRL